MSNLEKYRETLTAWTAANMDFLRRMAEAARADTLRTEKWQELQRLSAALTEDEKAVVRKEQFGG